MDSPNGTLVPELKTSRKNTVMTLPGVSGCSVPIQAAIEQVSLIAETDVTCLIIGETGTGKELFARGVHYLSSRKHHPFVPVNCGAVPDHLFENELFGHVSGAFTDARSNQTGLVAYAESGTLFLDEIDSLSRCAQVKLLRVLQEREYRPVGSPKAIPTNVRILAATNANLSGAVEAGRFREDLYFRLNVLLLEIPPLRDRLEDIEPLANYYVREYAGTYKRPVSGIEPAAVECLRNYSWPGNVRELQSVLQRAILRTRCSSVTLADIDLPGVTVVRKEQVALTLKAAKTAAVDQCERSYLAAVMRRCQGNVTQAAKLAGKERRSFQRLLRKHSIPVVTFRNTHEIA